MTCQRCVHCDTTEAVPAKSTPRIDRPEMAGRCTKPRHYFNGLLVPVWMVCPEYEAKEATHVS